WLGREDLNLRMAESNPLDYPIAQRAFEKIGQNALRHSPAIFAVQQAGDELQPFIHRVTLLPGPFALSQKARLCNPCLRNDQSYHLSLRKGIQNCEHRA